MPLSPGKNSAEALDLTSVPRIFSVRGIAKDGRFRRLAAEDRSLAKYLPLTCKVALSVPRALVRE